MRFSAFATAVFLSSAAALAQSEPPAAASMAPAGPPGVAVTGAAAPAPAVPAGPLTYAAALSLAEAQSLDTKRAALAVEAAAVDRALVDYDDDARINLFGTLSARYGEPASGGAAGAASTKAATDASALAMAAAKLHLTKSQAYGTQLSKTFLDFGRHDARVQQADALKAVRELQVGEVTEALRFKVARTYVALIGLERLAKLAIDQLKVSSDKLDQQRRNYKKGLRPESDVVTAEVEVGRALIARDRAFADARLARQALAQLIGAALDLDRLTLALGAYRLRDPRALADVALTWNAQQKSAAMARREKERVALVADETAVDASKRPTVLGAVMVQEGAALANKPVFKPVVTGSVGVSWDLPWTGQSRDERRRIAVRRQDLDVQEQIEARGRADRDAAAREVLGAGARQWDQLNRQLALVDRQRTLVRQRYELGKASALELGQADLDLLSSRTDLAKLANTLLGATIDVAEAHAVTDLGPLFQ